MVERWLPKPKVASSKLVYRSGRVPLWGTLSLYSAWEAKGLSDGSLPARQSRRSRVRNSSIVKKKYNWGQTPIVLFLFYFEGDDAGSGDLKDQVAGLFVDAGTVKISQFDLIGILK